MAFSKLKALLKKAAARSVEELSHAIPSALPMLTAEECSNYLAAAGYDAV